MKNINNKNELKERIELCLNNLNYFINETFYKKTLKMMLEYIEQTEDYRDAEERGLLLRLPCKVGDKVYADSNCFGILEYEVDEIIINGEKITFLCSAYSTPIGDCPSECLDEIEPDITDFEKLVFLTKEEAEQALAEMKWE